MARDKAGSESQKTRWLPKLADGALIATFFANESCPRPRFAGGTLDGIASPVLDSECARLAIILTDDGTKGGSLVAVNLDDPGIARTTLETVDPSRDVARLQFSNVNAERLGKSGDGWLHADNARLHAAILVAFEQVGGADRALEMARDYALERRTFGRPIGSYQGIKHKLVNVYMRNEVARAHAYYGAWALSTQARDLPLAAASARVSATEAFSLAAQENIQTHGGMGFTWEAGCHLFYRRARTLALELGSIFGWKERLIRELEFRNSR